MPNIWYDLLVQSHGKQVCHTSAIFLKLASASSLSDSVTRSGATSEHPIPAVEVSENWGSILFGMPFSLPSGERWWFWHFHISHHTLAHSLGMVLVGMPSDGKFPVRHPCESSQTVRVSCEFRKTHFFLSIQTNFILPDFFGSLIFMTFIVQWCIEWFSGGESLRIPLRRNSFWCLFRSAKAGTQTLWFLAGIDSNGSECICRSDQRGPRERRFGAALLREAETCTWRGMRKYRHTQMHCIPLYARYT